MKHLVASGFSAASIHGNKSQGQRDRAIRDAVQMTSPDATPPERQGNYAFRYFTTPQQNFEEFLALCEAAWPGFEAAYDSQVIGLWRFADATAEGSIDTLLLTRRPDLAMWERSKLPADAAEQEVRDKLSRRYDLCDATWVVTTTLITARFVRGVLLGGGILRIRIGVGPEGRAAQPAADLVEAIQ